MVDFEKVFHLTLLGLSVCDFVSQKGGITAFLSCKRSLQDQDLQEGKKAKIETVLPSPQEPPDAPKEAEVSTSRDIQGELGEWDQDVFDDLPNDIQKELLTAKNQAAMKTQLKHVMTKSYADNEVPSGWDMEVFQSLPEDVKNELLASKKPQAQARKPQNNSILKYFQKK